MVPDRRDAGSEGGARGEHIINEEDVTGRHLPRNAHGVRSGPSPRFRRQSREVTRSAPAPPEHVRRHEVRYSADGKLVPDISREVARDEQPTCSSPPPRGRRHHDGAGRRILRERIGEPSVRQLSGGKFDRRDDIGASPFPREHECTGLSRVLGGRPGGNPEGGEFAGALVNSARRNEEGRGARCADGGAVRAAAGANKRRDGVKGMGETVGEEHPTSVPSADATQHLRLPVGGENRVFPPAGRRPVSPASANAVNLRFCLSVQGLMSACRGVGAHVRHTPPEPVPPWRTNVTPGRTIVTPTPQLCTRGARSSHRGVRSSHGILEGARTSHHGACSSRHGARSSHAEC